MKYLIGIVSLLMSAPLSAQNTPESADKKVPRPKLVVGLVVDQMRWDFLYRYFDRYGEDGFKRMLREGFTCENAHIPYAQTVTAAGHACVYTGSVPAINGIMGNEWYDRQKDRDVYCVEDSSVGIVGGTARSEPMSPRNLWTTSISDELRLATNFRSKVVGVAIKDRGAILPAGHTGDAYWYESATGNWITSTWYRQSLPDWVNRFNARKMVDSLYALNWNTLYPIDTYQQSDADNVAYEGRFIHEKAPVFPHELASQMGTNFGTIRATPHGNTLTLEFAKAALIGEQLGQDDFTDMLAISLSSPDYIGHQFGPNSVEIEDTYLRLDKEIGDFLKWLDEKVGKGQWTLFMTADHGVAHVAGFLQKHKIRVATLSSDINALNEAVSSRFKVQQAIIASGNYHLYLDHEAITKARRNVDEVTQFIVEQLQRDSAVLMAFPARELEKTPMPAMMKERFANGMNAKLSGDIIVVLKPGFFFGSRLGTTHGAWYPYDSHIPMVFMGWGVPQGKTNRRTHMTDFAPTVAALLSIQPPSGCIGQPVTEITDPRK